MLVVGGPMKGTIRSLDQHGHGIIYADDGAKLPFLFIDVLGRKALVVGRRVVFAVRTVNDKRFAENISIESSHVRNSRAGVVKETGVAE
jgi:hypothetical protein